jgi:uncharacterized protein
MRALTLVLGILAATVWSAHGETAQHRLLIHVDSPNAEVMREALHNATNTIQTLQREGSRVAVEIVANGPGTAMFIAELSPVKSEVQQLHAAYPQIVMSACGISLAHTEAVMKKKLSVLPEARVVPSGAVRIMELEEAHWAYLKP